MTTKTKAVRGSYKPAEFQATERIMITPAHKRFIEKKNIVVELAFIFAA